MKRLTRQEIWDAISRKYPSFKALNIDSTYNNNSNYVRRDLLLKILYELKIDKSRHLTKEQKKRLKYEQELNVIKKL